MFHNEHGRQSHAFKQILPRKVAKISVRRRRAYNQCSKTLATNNQGQENYVKSPVAVSQDLVSEKLRETIESSSPVKTNKAQKVEKKNL